MSFSDLTVARQGWCRIETPVLHAETADVVSASRHLPAGWQVAAPVSRGWQATGAEHALCCIRSRVGRL